MWQALAGPALWVAGLTIAMALPSPAPPPPPLLGNCAHTPPDVEGNERTPSGNYVFFPRTGVAGHDLAWGAVSLWGGVDQLRTWCDHNATCIGYAVDTSLAQPQVWFKAAAALDYHGMAVSTCPSSKDCTSHPCPSDKWVPQWGSCPYGGHTGSVWTAGGLYIKCANKTKSFVCTGKAGLYQCVPGNSSNPTPTNGTSYPKEQQCLEACKAPPPPPPAPGPPPPAPHYDKPYLRFAMVIPMPQMVDCTITQGSVSHTWSQYGFGQFSDWISTFKAASASLTIATGGTTLLTQQVTLTPGPLVVALRPDNNPPGHYWPPTKTSIELIAASYSPTPTGTSGARLMNLSPDTDVAGFTVNGKPGVSGVKYGLGSDWAVVPSGQDTFSVTGGAKTVTVTGTPPLSPAAATIYFYGTSQYGLQAKLLNDAPEASVLE